MKLSSADQSQLMEVSRISIEGNNLTISGTIMGAIPIEAMLTPAELRRGLKLLNLRLIFFLLTMAFRS